MRLFRIIGQEEKQNLLENNNTIFKHKTCIDTDWILYPHIEDYETGKFFFFEIQDALKFAKEKYAFNNKDCSLLEVNINEDFILSYLGFGIYRYPDYDDRGAWDISAPHCIPEVLLPYNIFQNILDNNHYTMTDINKNHLLKYIHPNKKERNQSLLDLGEVVSKLCFAKKNFNYSKLKVSPGKKYTIYDVQSFEESKNKIEKYEPLLTEVYEKFVKNHRNYTSQLTEFLHLENTSEDILSK